MRVSHVVVFVVGAAIGVGATMAMHINRPGPDAGDWLGFVGALVGVSVTIMGTLWLEDYRSTRGERDNAKIYLASLNEIKSKLREAARERGAQPIAKFRPSQIQLEDDLVTAFEKFIYARHYVPRRNIEAWQAAEELADIIAKEKQLVSHESKLISDAGENENVLNVNLSKISQVQDRLVGHLESAIKTVSKFA